MERGYTLKITMRRFGKPFNPGEERRKKRNSFLSVVLFLICAVVVIAFATIIIEQLIRALVVPGQEETWAASVASYWGGIIGGIVSGILAVADVFVPFFFGRGFDKVIILLSLFSFIIINYLNRNVLVTACDRHSWSFCSSEN